MLISFQLGPIHTHSYTFIVCDASRICCVFCIESKSKSISFDVAKRQPGGSSTCIVTSPQLYLDKEAWNLENFAKMRKMPRKSSSKDGKIREKPKKTQRFSTMFIQKVRKTPRFAPENGPRPPVIATASS